MFIVFIPVWAFLFFPALMALRGETQGFLRAVGTLSWGLMMTVFTLSHMAMLLVSGDAENPVAGGLGLLFFLVMLTQFNDVAQYTWGKLTGRHKVTPTVSPKKTWEGLVGGIATTTVLAALIGPYLTPMDWHWSAADYFAGGMGWFAKTIIGIISVARGSGKQGGNPLAACEVGLDRGDILIIFPEGSRGEPEALAAFKKGIGHLAKARPKVPVIPIFMHGLGKALPKGSALLVPFNCLVSVGEPLYGKESHDAFVSELETRLTELAAEEKLPVWD